jgi:hypothetical protein
MLVGYIDAGTGALLLQWIIAAILGAGVFFRATIFGFIRKLAGKNPPAESHTDEGGQDTPEAE